MTPEQWAEKVWEFWKEWQFDSSGSKEQRTAILAEMFRQAMVDGELVTNGAELTAEIERQRVAMRGQLKLIEELEGEIARLKGGC